MMIDRFPVYIKTMQSCSSMLTPAHKVFRDRMTKKCMQFHVTSPKQTKCKVKNIAISSDPNSPFHCHACIFFSLFHHFFFMICDWGSPSFLCRRIFSVFSWPSIYVSYWFTVICEILKNDKFEFAIFNLCRNFRESWLGFIFYFFEIRDQKQPPPLFFVSFRLWKRCSKCLPLNCHYHQIGFALKQVVPVSY